LIVALLGLPIFLFATVLDYLFYKRTTYKDFYIGSYNLLSFTRTQRSSQGFAYLNLIRNISTNYHKTKPVNASKPVLNLVGEYDNIGHFNSPNIEKILSSQHTKYELIKDGGHWFMKSKSHYINKRILKFLE
jgi:pimeloyl-ACP methyl ester carboxylesterase